MVIWRNLNFSFSRNINMHTLCFLWEEAGFHHLTESHYLIHTAASGLLLMYWPLNWRNIMLFTSIQTMMLLLFIALMGADGRLWPVRTMRHKTVKWMVKWDPETEQRSRFFLWYQRITICKFVLYWDLMCGDIWWHAAIIECEEAGGGGGF